MARCLRCHAGNEWIEGRVPDEQIDDDEIRIEADLDDLNAWDAGLHAERMTKGLRERLVDGARAERIVLRLTAHIVPPGEEAGDAG